MSQLSSFSGKYRKHQRKLIGIFVLFGLLFINFGSSQAAPADPFAGSSPSFDAAAAPGSSTNSGDWGVSAQNGAATYTFPIEVPQGRNGMAPSLALRYSSNSPLRGGLAVGWTFHLPAIERDLSLGVAEGEHYQASLGSVNGRLVEVDEPSPYGNGSAYRLQFDTSATRFFKFDPDTIESVPDHWVALTSDGIRHYFEEVAREGVNGQLVETKWRITRQEDSFGNSVIYNWANVIAPNGNHIIDQSLVSIEYTFNEGAGLIAHAKVEFEYAALDVCSGSNVPIGAAMRRGSQQVNGAQRLTAVTTHVRDTQNSDWRLSKRIDLSYKLRNSTFYDIGNQLPSNPATTTINCKQNQLRYLAQIDSTAYDANGSATTTPPVKLDYNNRIDTSRPFSFPSQDPMREITISTPGYGQEGSSGSALGGITATLLDIDNDGIRDRTSVIEENEICTLVWQKGLLGGAFESQAHKSPLPTAAWYRDWRGISSSFIDSQEGCTLSGQIAYRTQPSNDPQTPTTDFWAKGVMSYHFMDYTGDGRLDLITNVWASSNCHWTYDPWAIPIANDYCSFNRGTQTVGGATSSPLAPEKFGSRFRWRVYAGTGNPDQPFYTNPTFPTRIRVNSPVALPPSSSEEQLDKTRFIHYTIPTLFDLDGDGFLDAIDTGDTTRTACNNEILLRECDWTVYFGDGTGTFPTTGEAYVWPVPKETLASDEWTYGKCGTALNAPQIVSSRSVVINLLDLNGDGLADLIVRLDDGLMVSYRNNGAGFDTQAQSLNSNSALEKSRTECDQFIANTLTDGDRGFLQRLIDLDGDGLLDLVWFEGGASITSTTSVKAKFNMGDHFGNEVTLLFPEKWANSKRLLSANWQPRDGFAGSWHVSTDFTDVTGDGLADLVQWHGNSMTYISSPGLPTAPDLLRRVTNGRGLELTFSYAPSTNHSVVNWTDNDSTLPHVSWVVKAMTVAGGLGTPPSTVQYQYDTPNYLSAAPYSGYKERSQFAGFSQNKQTNIYANSGSQEVRKQYSYTGLNGELVGSQTYLGNQLHKAARYELLNETLFNGRIHNTLPLQATTCTTNAANMSESACFAQDDHVRRTENTWQAHNSNACNLFFNTQQLEGVGQTTQAGDRRAIYQFNVRCGTAADPEDYRIQVLEITNAIKNANNTFTPTGRVTTTYNNDTGLPARLRTYLDPGTFAETNFVYDGTTGNLLRFQKPMQNPVNGGSDNASTYTYDSHQLFVYAMRNELGHLVRTTYDVATGVLIKREGPNAIHPVFNEIVLEPLADSYVSEEFPSDNFGNETTFVAGLKQDPSCAGNFCRMDSLLQFDITPILNQNVVAAELRLHVAATEGNPYPTTLSIAQYAPNASWSEATVTYDNYPQDLAGRFCNQQISSQSEQAVWQCGRLADWVQDWANGTANNGLLLQRRNNFSTTNAHPAFVSREDPVTANHPQLVVTTLQGPAQTIYDTERWEIDGYGRILTHSISIDTEVNGLPSYEERVIGRFTYNDMNFFNSGQPVSQRMEQLQDFDGTHWIPTEQDVDGLGRILSTRHLFNNAMTTHTTYTYNDQGQIQTIATPDPRNDSNPILFNYTYDNLGRVVSFERPDNTSTAISYTGLTQTIQDVTPDGSGGAKTRVYDVFGRLIELHEAGNNVPSAVTQYQYDAHDNLDQIIDAEGNVTQMTHDWLSNRVAIIRGNRSWQYEYDLNSNLIVTQSPMPTGATAADYTTTYTYDDLDRLSTTSFVDIRLSIQPTTTAAEFTIFLPLVINNAATTQQALPALQKAAVSEFSTILYTYDQGVNGNGRLSQVTLPFGQIQYNYDARGLLTQEQRDITLNEIATLNISQQVNRSYNAAGQLIQSTWQDGQQWRITYDERGLVDTVAWFDPIATTWQAVADYERDLLGLPTTRSTDYAQTSTFTYDVMGRPLTNSTTLTNNPTPIAQRAYIYTDSGDLASVTGQTNGISANASYTYDAYHRLLTANGPNGYQGSFTYSATGNILSANVTWNDAPDTRNVTYNYGQLDPQAVDELQDIATGDTYAAFTYDEVGNMTWRSTPDGDTLLHWNGRAQIRRVDTPDGSETYYYDHAGQRILVINPDQGARFWFSERETHFNLGGTESLNYLHLAAGGATLARVENGTNIELQYADALQNLMFSLDETGNVIASFLYGPFGEVVSATGEETHSRQFNGKENDAATGLRYYGYRYYDPLTLRWNSADPLYTIAPDYGQLQPQRMNLYAFSLNNPLRYYDPDGRDAKDDDDGENTPEPDGCNPQSVESDKCNGEDTESEDEKPATQKPTTLKELDQLINKAIKACKTSDCILNIIAQLTLELCKTTLCQSPQNMEGGSGLHFRGKAERIYVMLYNRYSSAIYDTEFYDRPTNDDTKANVAIPKSQQLPKAPILMQLEQGKTLAGPIGGAVVYSAINPTNDLTLHKKAQAAANIVNAVFDFKTKLSSAGTKDNINTVQGVRDSLNKTPN